MAHRQYTNPTPGFKVTSCSSVLQYCRSWANTVSVTRQTTLSHSCDVSKTLPHRQQLFWHQHQPFCCLSSLPCTWVNSFWTKVLENRVCRFFSTQRSPNLGIAGPVGGLTNPESIENQSSALQTDYPGTSHPWVCKMSLEPSVNHFPVAV